MDGFEAQALVLAVMVDLELISLAQAEDYMKKLSDGVIDIMHGENSDSHARNCAEVSSHLERLAAAHVSDTYTTVRKSDLI